MSTHEGHRDRMRERFRDNGGAGFQKHELVEMLLYSAYPRRDTNEMAHRVLEQFGGSLTKLIHTDPETISKMCGISINAATLFSLIGEINRRAAIEKWDEKVILSSTATVGEFAISYLEGLNIEKVYVICLNASLALIKCVEAAVGTSDSALIEVRKVVGIAISNNASSIILMHNHPSGGRRPSYEDIKFTSDCLDALSAIKIDLADHIIVADGEYFSFKAEGVLPVKKERIGNVR